MQIDNLEKCRETAPNLGFKSRDCHTASLDGFIKRFIKFFPTVDVQMIFNLPQKYAFLTVLPFAHRIIFYCAASTRFSRSFSLDWSQFVHDNKILAFEVLHCVSFSLYDVIYEWLVAIFCAATSLIQLPELPKTWKTCVFIVNLTTIYFTKPKK